MKKGIYHPRNLYVEAKEVNEIPLDRLEILIIESQSETVPEIVKELAELGKIVLFMQVKRRIESSIPAKLAERLGTRDFLELRKRYKRKTAVG